MICGRCGTEFYDKKECPACYEDKRPFYKKNLGESEKNIFSIRLNDQERAILEDIKSVLDIDSDGSALKIVAFTGWEVIQRSFGRENLKWLCDKNRLSRRVK